MSHGELVYIQPDGDVIYGQRPFWRLAASADVMIRLKRIFPRAKKHRQGWITLDHTVEVARDLEWVLGRWAMEVSAADLDRLRGAADEHRQREEAVLSILSGDRPHLQFMDPARPAREYQLVAADLALTTRSLLLADDLGLGKSMSGLLVLRDPECLPALIVCPTHLPRQWQDELGKTLPWLRAHIIRTGRPYDPSKRREMKGHDPDVLIVNYHKIRGWADHLAGRVRTVIFDEAQELRRAESEKYKAAAQIADAADVKVGLTATPVYNYAGEIHNVFSVLAPGVLGSREEFAREWGTGYWHDKCRVKDPAALGTYLRDQGLMLRRTRADVGRELPEVVRVPHSVDADERVHEQLMEGTLDLAETILTGSRKDAFTAAGDLDWQMRQATGIAKAPYVAEFVKLILESERKVVLFGWHRKVYDLWLEHLADFDPVLYTGSESPAQKDAARTRFLDDDECRVFIMSLRSGAGLDGLQAASNVAVFGELDWSPGMHEQCIGRLHRDGQAQSVVAYFLVSDIGSDPVIADVLNVKRMQAEPLRDPDAKLFEAVEDTSGRVRKLAEQVMAKRKQTRIAA
ncbi:MAG: SNF2-related protein [Solirubrobacteraceae bacterium]